MTVKVKICGITNLRDALEAAEFGADMVGFNFYSKSPRYVPPREAANIALRVPRAVLKVGVFVNSTTDDISDIADAVKLDVIQLHGDEDDNFIRVVGHNTEKPVIKAFQIDSETSIYSVLRSDADAVLLDAVAVGAFGGTGRTFDWNLVGGDLKHKQVFLAGGLTHKNVIEAVSIVRPYAVDVASGVESGPGEKDPKKVRQFIENAKNA
jgi:phosphoribosylanthranilate isomerase